jgi:hypothetical protein
VQLVTSIERSVSTGLGVVTPQLMGRALIRMHSMSRCGRGGVFRGGHWLSSCQGAQRLKQIWEREGLR